LGLVYVIICCVELDRTYDSNTEDIEMIGQENTREFFEPLCDASAKVFAKLDLEPEDVLHVSLPEKKFVLWVTSNKPTRFASYDARHYFFGRFPERQNVVINEDNGALGYAVPATDFTVLLVYTLWPSGQMQFEDEAATVTFKYLLARFMSQSFKARARAKYRAEKIVPQFEHLDNANLPLSPYQTVALYGCLRQESAALFMEQGTGKTPVVIARICNEASGPNYSSSRMYRALIVCPKNVRLNWRNEFGRFSTVAGRVAVLRGGKFNRVRTLVEAFKKNGDDARWVAVICSYEAMTCAWDVLSAVQWDLCVLDESHYIKASYTRRWRQAQKLREICAQRMCLTGTPTTNMLFDLYTQLEFLGEGLSGFASFKSFRYYYGRWAKARYGEILTGYTNVPLLQERLARLAFIIQKKEALPDLPDKLYDIVEVAMTPVQRNLYIKLATRLAVEIRDKLREPNTLSVSNVLTKLLRLAQITSGFVRWDDRWDDETLKPGATETLIPNPKLDALMALLKDRLREEKVIVWCCFVHDIKLIVETLVLEGVKCVTLYGATDDEQRAANVKAFNEDPDTRVLIGNPVAGGIGVNLLGYNVETGEGPGCQHVVYYSQNWSMTARAQSEDRTHRRGTREPVHYTDLVVPGTIDEEIRARVLQKRISAYQLQDIHDILNRLLEVFPEGDEE